MNEIDFTSLDKKIAIGSGVLTGVLDILMVPELSFSDANTWGSDRIQSFTLSYAKDKGYSGDDISDAIKYLKDEKTEVKTMFAEAFSLDTQTDDLDANTDESSETEDETPVVLLSDQLGIEGLIFSIISHVTGKSIGIDSDGTIVCKDMEGLSPKSLEEGIYWGTLRWLFNYVYDALEKGIDWYDKQLDPEIPIEIREILTKLTAFPGLEDKAKKILEFEDALHDKDKFFERISELILSSVEQGNDGKYHFGMILGVAHEMVEKKQYVPVLLNEVIVSSFFTVSRFLMKLCTIDIDNIQEIDRSYFKDCLPIQNEELQRMRKLASTTFMSINVVKSGIKAITQSNNNPKDFGVHFLQNINYMGAAEWIACVSPDRGTALDFFYDEFKAMAEEQRKLFKDILHKVNEAVGVAGKVRETAKTIANIASPTTYVRAVNDVYVALRETYADLQMARERRIRIEAQCAEHIRELQQYKSELQQAISEYFVRKYTAFDLAFDSIDKALLEDDIDMFISGQNIIQRELSGKVMFESMEEFDELMNSDDTIVF